MFINFRKTSLHCVCETIRSEAQQLGVKVVGSEIIGQGALLAAPERYLRIEELSPNLVFENREEEE